MTLHRWTSQLHRNLGLLFLLGFIVLGVANTFLLPPFQVPDERRHWLAAHHHMARLVTGSGNVCSMDVALVRHFQLGLEFQPRAKLPSGIFSQVDQLVPECEEKVMYPLSNVSSYPAVLLSRLVVPREPRSGGQSLFGFYLSRLLGGSLIALLMWRMWWLAGMSSQRPPGLLALSLLALSPLFVQQAFGVTNDVVAIAFALAVCSWVVFPDRQTRLDEILLLCLGLVAALTKPVLSVPLLPAIALGLYLDRIRTAPTEPAPAIRSLAQAFAGRWVFAAGLVVISVTGLAFASTSLNPENPRPGAQLEFVLENPLHAPALILSKFVTFFWHPSVFIDNLGYGSTRIGAGTLACFGMLVAIVVFVELAGLGTQIDRLRKGRTHRGGVRRAWGPVAGVAIVAITCLVASAFAIGFRSYLVASPIGGNRLYAMQARYLFPCLIVGIGLAIAMARTFLTDPGRSDVPTRAARRTERVSAAVVIGFAAATLLAFSAQLATDLLARYS